MNKKLLFCLLMVFQALVQAQSGLGIGDSAPSFEADSTRGLIHFPQDFRGQWIILFSHPADFTPVCATEFKRLASLVHQFKKLNAQLVGLSVDSAYTHKIWMKNLEKESNRKVNFPVIADTSLKIAKRYGMIHPRESTSQTVRSVYFIDPKGTIRALFYYPIANGRSFDEILRLLEALQITDRENVATPADWVPGRPTIKKERAYRDILAD